MAKIRCGSGVSFQCKNVWYKLYFEEERESTEPFTEKDKQDLWQVVNTQVDSQVNQIIKEGEEK